MGSCPRARRAQAPDVGPRIYIRTNYEQEPPSTTVRGSASFAHLILHVESPAQDNEQLAVQRSVHVDPPSQLMLPLGPTVTSHSEPPLQLTLHDAPHVPPQLL